jgi:aspartyl-tRNA(Asn)/glutamyl-tRNA(Gln) amidotransferase subunit C
MTDARADELVSQLNTILGHMDVLSKVKTDGMEPVAGIGADTTPLADDATPSVALERKPETFAPAMKEGFLLVPRLATHETAEES